MHHTIRIWFKMLKWEFTVGKGLQNTAATLTHSHLNKFTKQDKLGKRLFKPAVFSTPTPSSLPLNRNLSESSCCHFIIASVWSTTVDHTVLDNHTELPLFILTLGSYSYYFSGQAIKKLLCSGCETPQLQHLHSTTRNDMGRTFLFIHLFYPYYHSFPICTIIQNSWLWFIFEHLPCGSIVYSATSKYPCRTVWRHIAKMQSGSGALWTKSSKLWTTDNCKW